jgi:hypothetical protein
MVMTPHGSPPFWFITVLLRVPVQSLPGVVTVNGIMCIWNCPLESVVVSEPSCSEKPRGHVWVAEGRADRLICQFGTGLPLLSKSTMVTVVTYEHGMRVPQQVFG